MRIASKTIGMAMMVGLAAIAHAQNPPPGTPTAPQGRGRGGGRGRAVAAMTLTSPGIKDGASIAKKYSQAGEELSPPLAWSGAPDSTKSFVLIVHDLNAPVGGGAADDVLHWMVWNIPGTATSLPEGVPQGPELPDGSRQISVSGPYYRGPAAPSSGPVHHYAFELFALDALLELPAVGAAPAATRTALIAAMAGHIRGKGVFVASYRRDP